MAVLTFSPWVALALILGLLLVVVLVAFSLQAAENILRFFTGLLDLYQRLQLLHSRSSPLLPEQNAMGTEQDRGPDIDKAPVTVEPPHVLAALQPPNAGQQQLLSASETVGEQRR